MKTKVDPVALIDDQWDGVMWQVMQGNLKFRKPHLYTVWVIDLSGGIGRELGMALARGAGRVQELVSYILDCRGADSNPVQTVCMSRKKSIKLAKVIGGDVVSEVRKRPPHNHRKVITVQGDSVHVLDVSLPDELSE